MRLGVRRICRRPGSRVRDSGPRAARCAGSLVQLWALPPWPSASVLSFRRRDANPLAGASGALLFLVYPKFKRLSSCILAIGRELLITARVLIAIRRGAEMHDLTANFE